MVKKITSGEYLKRFDNMTAVERQEYLSRVGDWLAVGRQALAGKIDVFESRLQNVLQVSMVWNDAECQAFEDGAVLLSALVGVADTKLPDLLYAISAKRAIKRMFQLLLGTEAEGAGAGGKTYGMKSADVGGKTAENTANGESDGKMSARPAVQTAANGQKAADVERREKANSQSVTVNGGVPPRPRHIDQYVHLLPAKTQERAANYGPLMRELDEAREKLRLLTEDPTASAADREAWAKKCVSIDKAVGSIRLELDAEWDKLAKSGRVVVDDLGNARVSEERRVKSEEPGALEPAELTSEQKHKRRELRKWLIDTRRGNGSSREARVEQWYRNFSEYLMLEGDAAFEDAKIKEAIAHYGIDVSRFKH